MNDYTLLSLTLIILGDKIYLYTIVHYKRDIKPDAHTYSSLTHAYFKPIHY